METLAIAALRSALRLALVPAVQGYCLPGPCPYSYEPCQ